MKSTLVGIIYLFISIHFVSCAKTDEQEVRSAIKEARYYLTNLECQDAQDILDDVGEQKDNADYVSVYASSIACKSGYTDMGTAINNLTNIDTTGGGASLLGSFAAFISSNETTADAVTYSKIVESINYILNADGGTQPSTTARLAKYGKNDGNDLSMQAILMITVAMGKYFAFYGNTDSLGVKGAGSIVGGDRCIGFYPFDAQVDTSLGASPLKGCDSANAGHADLNFGTVASSTVYRRMCEGIVLFNNLFEILSNIDLSSNTSLGNVGQVATTINSLFSAAQIVEASLPWGGTAVSTLKSITSQSVCEAQSAADIQRYYVLIFETNL